MRGGEMVFGGGGWLFGEAGWPARCVAFFAWAGGGGRSLVEGRLSARSVFFQGFGLLGFRSSFCRVGAEWPGGGKVLKRFECCGSITRFLQRFCMSKRFGGLP